MARPVIGRLIPLAGGRCGGPPHGDAGMAGQQAGELTGNAQERQDDLAVRDVQRVGEHLHSATPIIPGLCDLRLA